MNKVTSSKIYRELGLDTENSIITGSGILQALNIRQSGDIDLMVTTEIFDRLKNSGEYKLVNKEYGDILSGKNIDLRKVWRVLNKEYDFSSIKKETIIIDGYRYLSPDFLYRVKKSWIKRGTARPKDVKDVKLLNNYLNQHID